MRVSTKEAMNFLMKKARENGYKDWRRFLAEEVFRNWNEEDVIYQSYQDFLEACQLHEKKAFSDDERWGEDSTFEEWVAESLQVISMRLEQLEKQRKNTKPSFQKLANLVEEGEKIGLKSDIITPGVGEVPPPEIFEFYEEVLKRTRETLIKFQKGQLKIPTAPSWQFKEVQHEDTNIKEVELE